MKRQKRSYKDRTHTPGPVGQYACPMCGWWRTIQYGINRTGEPREVRFDKVDPHTAIMWRRDQVGGGQITRLESKKLVELPDNIKDQVRQQCKAILKELGYKVAKIRHSSQKGGIMATKTVAVPGVTSDESWTAFSGDSYA